MDTNEKEWKNASIKAILMYGFLFGYILSFLFEGKVYDILGADFSFDTKRLVLPTILFHVIGLCFGAFLDLMKRYKRWCAVVFYAICILSTILFGANRQELSTVSLMVAAFCAGMIVSLWGYYYKTCFSKKNRLKGIALSILFANLLMVLAEIMAILFSGWVGFFFSIAYLIVAFLVFINSGQLSETITGISTEVASEHWSLFCWIKGRKTILLFLLYIFMISIDSGLMYHMVVPTYQHLGTITDWYWAIPYITVIGMIAILPKRVTKYNSLLYFSSMMIAIAFILFLYLDLNIIHFLVVDTFLLGASGILDITWAGCLLGEGIEYTNKSIAMFGISLSANAGGVLFGGILAEFISNLGMPKTSCVVLALFIICLTLILLSNLIKALETVMESKVIVEQYAKRPTNAQDEIVSEHVSNEALTKREEEVFNLLLCGENNEVISAKLCISINTVKTHVRNILRKYEVSNRTELISKVLKR